MQLQLSTSATGAEVWRPVPGYEGLYEISDLGRVRRIARDSIGRRITQTRGGVLSPTPRARGYLQVRPCRDGKARGLFVHRLVIEAFLGPFSPGEESNHKNGMHADNRLVNLEKVTHPENVRHAIITGLMQSQGEHNPQAKLSEDDVRTIRRLAETVTVQELALRFLITPRAVRLILRRRTWRHI